MTADEIKRNQLIATLCAKTMDYRGLGSGIIRALQSDNNIEFRNEVNGDQFRVILWRSDLKSKEKTTQKTDLIGSEKTECSEKTTRKIDLIGSEKAESSEKNTQKTDLIGSEKTESSEKTEDLITKMISENSKVTINILSKQLSISERAVSKQLKKLQQSGRIRRVGPDKGGHWEIC